MASLDFAPYGMWRSVRRSYQERSRAHYSHPHVAGIKKLVELCRLVCLARISRFLPVLHGSRSHDYRAGLQDKPRRSESLRFLCVASFLSGARHFVQNAI